MAFELEQKITTMYEINVSNWVNVTEHTVFYRFA